MSNGGAFGLAGARRRRSGSSSAVVRTATDGRDVLLNTPDGWEVDERWRWFDGPDGSDGTGGPFGNPLPGAWPPPGWALPAVTRCTQLIADILAGLPWHVYRDREKLPTPDWITDPQAQRVDQRIVSGPVPDWRQSAPEFWSSIITSILWWGEGLVYVPARDSAGQPVPPVWQINPEDVAIFDGTAYGVVGDDDEPTYLFAPQELIVIRGLTRPGETRGIGVLQNHAYDLDLARAVRDFARGMFGRGVPSGYLKVNAPQLTQPQATNLQRAWMAQHGGIQRKIAVLNATTDFHELRMDPFANQLTEMRRYSTLDVALLFGVPPYMLGLPSDSSTYANVESRMIELRQFTYFPWARRIETALGAEFPRGTDLKINLDALLRATTLDRYNAHKVALEAGFLTVDEVRDLEDRPPLIPDTLQGVLP